MPEKNSNKVPFSENDIATLVQRYDATILLTLLQEIAHYPDTKKFDWNELVKKTSTGISNPREYQMLWRYLAYHDSLSQIFEEADQPVDDDSDLDCEPESLASVSVESASESSACVKVMIASRTLSESTPSSSTIEAPLTVYLPVCCSSRTPKENSQPSDLMGQASISFPVTVHRQTLPTVSSTDALETKGLVGGTMASKRKRKAWSEEEDNLLRAAVQRLGEGNWATMAKGDDFPVKRSATQLAQRWSTLRKKDCSTNTGTNVTNTQYTTAEQLATRHSLSLALDMPFKKLTAPGMTNPNPGRTSTPIKNQVQSRNATEVSTVRSSVPAQRPSQQAVLGSCGSPAKSKLASESSASKCNTISGPSQQAVLGSCGSPAKSKLASENPVSKCNAISGRELKPAIVHSGAQTVSRPNTLTVSRPNTPTVLRPNTPTVSRPNTLPQFKVAQAKNVVHPVPAGSSLTKTPISAGLPSVQKDKHVTSVKEEVKRVSDIGSTPKEKVKEAETSALTIQSQVDSKLDKAKLDLDKAKSMPSEKILENKVVVSQNPRGCEEQGSVQNSNLTPKKVATENGNDKVNKESQVQNQDKKTNSSNGSSNQQSMNEKQVNLPKQDECRQGLEQPK